MTVETRPAETKTQSDNSLGEKDKNVGMVILVNFIGSLVHWRTSFKKLTKNKINPILGLRSDFEYTETQKRV